LDEVSFPSKTHKSSVHEATDSNLLPVIMIVKRNDVRRPRITRGGLRVSFSDVPEEVREVIVAQYPSNFFYTECDVIR